MKVSTFREVAAMVRRAKTRKKKIVTTNGCFDILHVGHVNYLEYAKSLGDLLIVGINSDRSVRRNKGPMRPIVHERERAKMVASLKPVDAVFIFDDTTPTAWLAKLKPNVHVKGGDRSIDEIVEKNAVQKYGGKIAIAPHTKGKSTTSVIKQIRSSRTR
jgi:D-glycero-beta-D-manno-heptose 1-phosphate adenylyltransferase